MKINKKNITIILILISVVLPINFNILNKILKRNYLRKSFYIMKVIYINIIYRTLSKNVRNVQQSLYMGKPKYILKI